MMRKHNLLLLSGRSASIINENIMQYEGQEKQTDPFDVRRVSIWHGAVVRSIVQRLESRSMSRVTKAGSHFRRVKCRPDFALKFLGETGKEFLSFGATIDWLLAFVLSVQTCTGRRIQSFNLIIAEKMPLVWRGCTCDMARPSGGSGEVAGVERWEGSKSPA